MDDEAGMDGDIRRTLQAASIGAGHFTCRFMAISDIEVNKR
jgi:hypothetical protein